MSFAIARGGLTNTIWVGVLNKQGHAFLHKADLTNPAVWAVAEHIEAANYENDGNCFEIFRGGDDYGYRLTVQRIPKSVPQSLDGDTQYVDKVRSE
jgi:hypothetical protein